MEERKWGQENKNSHIKTLRRLKETTKSTELQQAAEVSQLRGARVITPEDLLFLMRKDKAQDAKKLLKKKLRRLLKYMFIRDYKSKIVKGIDEDDLLEAYKLSGSNNANKRQKIAQDFLNSIDQTGELLAMFEDDEIDEVKQERMEDQPLKRESDFAFNVNFSIIMIEVVNLDKSLSNCLGNFLSLISNAIFIPPAKAWISGALGKSNGCEKTATKILKLKPRNNDCYLFPPFLHQGSKTVISLDRHQHCTLWSQTYSEPPHCHLWQMEISAVSGPELNLHTATSRLF
ncbi:hypothetical protein P7K49_008062 [Saguinus oedipus]|uniref:Uncharacterized protein n=1 Tax=Saguinus oedipus TaxID=9490 RepID=A0ABQ9VXE3_SAGOE|nr:hypothetical protein P7K49_008062 [Saguinus oedipus]